MTDDWGKFYRAKEKQKRIRCFADGIDWQHHLEGDSKGTLLFPSEADLREEAGHDLNECGIVEIEVRLVRWVVPQDLHRCEKSGGHIWHDMEPDDTFDGPWKKCSKCGSAMTVNA